MFRRLGLLLCSVALGVLATTVAPVSSFAGGGSPVACAGATTTTISATTTTTAAIKSGSPPPTGSSCWTDVQPYPFGSEGGPVPSSSQCSPGSPEELRCYLTVTSMAFRAWNFGLAVTEPDAPGVSEDHYPLWIFNGTRWYSDPTPPPTSCTGNTIVWAGKLDYWLVGGLKWADVCRFDGETLEWEPLEIPPATRDHVAETFELVNGNEQPKKLKPGGITSGACFAWNDCWFFGTYGTVVHWAGEHRNQPPLIDASPGSSQGLLQGEYTAAVAREGPAGQPFGVAVGATSEESEFLGPLQKELDGAPPAQLFGSSGGAFSPLAFNPFTIPQQSDPYRTDLVAVDFDSAGQGWVAGNPAGLRLEERDGQEPRGEADAPEQPASRKLPSTSLHLEQPSPLEPVSTSGVAVACANPPPPTRFTYTPFTEAPEEPGAFAGAFLWSSIAVLPSVDEALAGGQMRRAKPGSGPNEDAAVGEPAIAQAGCNGTTSVTRFRVEDLTSQGSEAPADREGGVTAIAANATNDAWASTSRGQLRSGLAQPPHIYRLTNGEPPDAPEGNDEEAVRERETEEEQPTFVNEPPPPEPPPGPTATVTQTHTVRLAPAIYDVKAKLHEIKRHGQVYLDLYITFKVRRSVTVGAQALRHRRVVSVARPKHFAGHTGLLILSLNRKHWPTKVNFTS